MRDVIVGVDVGGTFTDLFMLDAATGRFRTAKVPSWRGDEARGFLDGLRMLGGAAGIGSIVHGTTIGTNTLIERRGPTIGIITTRGFRDTLEMRRRYRRRTWGLWGDFVPIAARDFRLEVDERMLADGTIPTPVDAAQVREAAKLLRDKGAQAVAIAFINAYANAENERQALAALRPVWPNDFVTASHEVLSEIREFERSSTAALNAYLQPVVASISARSTPRSRPKSSPAGCTSCSRTAASCRSPPHANFRCARRRPGPVRRRRSARRWPGPAGPPRLRSCADLGAVRPLRCGLSIAGGTVAIEPQTIVQVRPRDPHADDRDHDHWCRRRLDRLGRSRRPAEGRAGKLALVLGAGLLRCWQHAADADRRPSGAWLHQCRAAARRRVDVARFPRRSGHRARCR